MNSRKLQDVVPARSIRNVPIPPKRGGAGNSASSGNRASSRSERNEENDRDFLIERLNRRSSSSSRIDEDPIDDFDGGDDGAQHYFAKWGLWTIGIAAVVFFSFSIILFFAGATVTITPKQITVPIQKTITATNSTTNGDLLTYQVLTLTKQASTTIPLASSTKSTIDQFASGKITIYNDFSTSPQVLVKNTRFEGPDGLIYRIRDSIKVPGKSTKGVPGSLEVTVYADKPGAQYNIGIVDFTVPGFKTDATRYSKIYAHSKTEMTGGLAKNELSPSADTLKSIADKLQSDLKDAALREARAQKTGDTVLYEALAPMTYSPTTQKQLGADSVAVIQEGTIHAILFNKKALSQLLLGDAMAKVGNEVEIQGLESLIVTPATATASSTKALWQQSPLNLTISGQITVKGAVDGAKVAAALRGQPKAQLTNILTQFPTIESAKPVIRPFWKDTFPVDLKKIKITVITP